jgi:hypothetical protein
VVTFKPRPRYSQRKTLIGYEAVWASEQVQTLRINEYLTLVRIVTLAVQPAAITTELTRHLISEYAKY